MVIFVGVILGFEFVMIIVVRYGGGVLGVIIYFGGELYWLVE